uniref:Dual specificity phosphatase 22 n=1 Tax=Equus caballus TaxID=9796 RepID=A0A9L0SDH8_HORSE
MRTLSGLTLRFQVTAGVLSYLLMPSQCLGVELNAPSHFISLHGEHLSLGELAVAPLAVFWTRHFKESIKFIHECRLRGEGCLVHCLAGVSRSVTLVIAYIMTVTDFGWEDALHTVRAGRSCANPNLGFQRQLQDFEKHEVHQYRQWLKEEYGESPLRDAEEARNILDLFQPGTQNHAYNGGVNWPPALTSTPFSSLLLPLTNACSSEQAPWDSGRMHRDIPDARKDCHLWSFVSASSCAMTVCGLCSVKVRFQGALDPGPPRGLSLGVTQLCRLGAQVCPCTQNGLPGTRLATR